MDAVTYSDLFEDEVAEVLRETPCISAITTAHQEFYPAHMTCEDGIYNSGTGMFTAYLDGKRTGTQVNTQYLLSALAHTTFKVFKNA